MKYKKIMFGIALAFIFLVSVGFSYAYFSNAITNKDVKNQVVETGTLQLTYTDGPEINIQNMKPGNTINKTITVKNTGSLEASYNIIWQKLINEITNDEMLIEGTCTSSNGTCDSIVSSPISDKNIKKNISIASGVTHTYNLTITFKETNTSQNYNQGKKFNGVLGIEEAKDNEVCSYSGRADVGASFTRGIYTYSYLDYKPTGWGVELTDKDSTDSVTEAPCVKINDDYVIYMSGMFSESKAVTIDVSSFNTSNVISMSTMFADSAVTEIKGLDKIDTSNVTEMSGMFAGMNVNKLNLSNFNTSKVVYMNSMFDTIHIKTLDITGFNTSNVAYMMGMFSGASIDNIVGLDSFDTSNVTEMYDMFLNSSINILDLSSFDVRSDAMLDNMFNGTSATIGYAKDEDTAELFNNAAVTGIPDTLKFTVKQ